MTTPVTLRSARGVKIDRPRLIDFGGQLRPPLGGPVQTINRLGTRHALDITIPTMRSEPDGRLWAADLRMAKLYGVIASFRQDGLAIGSPGTPLVDGAGQYGTAIALKGFMPGYEMRLGQAVSLFCAGVWFLYFSAAPTTADGTGRMSLPIFPMIRKSPANNATAEVADPKIQGSLSGNEVAWTRMTAPFCDFGTITITEDA